MGKSGATRPPSSGRTRFLDVPDQVLWSCGLPSNIFEVVATLAAEERDAPGGLLDQSAEALAGRFVDGHVGFWEANGVLNALMQTAEWKGPLRFWRIFLAFEDSETHDNPHVAAGSRLAAELSGLGS